MCLRETILGPETWQSKILFIFSRGDKKIYIYIFVCFLIYLKKLKKKFLHKIKIYIYQSGGRMSLWVSHAEQRVPILLISCRCSTGCVLASLDEKPPVIQVKNPVRTAQSPGQDESLTGTNF